MWEGKKIQIEKKAKHAGEKSVGCGKTKANVNKERNWTRNALAWWCWEHIYTGNKMKMVERMKKMYKREIYM